MEVSSDASIPKSWADMDLLVDNSVYPYSADISMQPKISSKPTVTNIVLPAISLKNCLKASDLLSFC